MRYNTRVEEVLVEAIQACRFKYLSAVVSNNGQKLHFITEHV